MKASFTLRAYLTTKVARKSAMKNKYINYFLVLPAIMV